MPALGVWTDMNEQRSYCNDPVLSEQLGSLDLSEEGLSVFFRMRKIERVALCGFGELVYHLYDKLILNGVEVCYLIGPIDSKGMGDMPVYSIGDVLPGVDLIIVSDTDGYMDTERRICERNFVEVISLQELIDKVLRSIKRG